MDARLTWPAELSRVRLVLRDTAPLERDEQTCFCHGTNDLPSFHHESSDGSRHLALSPQVLAGLEKQGVRCTTALDAHGSRFISRLAAAANAQDAEAALAKRPELVGQLMHAAANYFTPNWRMRPREGHKGRAVTPGVVVAVQVS